MQARINWDLQNGRTGSTTVTHGFQCGLGNDGCTESPDTTNYDRFRWTAARLTGYRSDHTYVLIRFNNTHQ